RIRDDLDVHRCPLMSMIDRHSGGHSAQTDRASNDLLEVRETRVLLIHDLEIRIIHAATGEIIRTLTLNPEHQYQPTGKPIGGPRRPYGPYGPRKTKKPEP
ncbi:MAG: hypothetical protein ACXVLX_16710, partial [Ilumatobacteraceae bacterium]